MKHSHMGMHALLGGYRQLCLHAKQLLWQHMHVLMHTCMPHVTVRVVVLTK